jgi:predicted MPP superfamily phosphohydrolase
VNRRTFLKRSAAVAAASAVGTVGYAIGIEPHWLEFVSRDLPISDLPRALDGRTLAHVSDIHVGPRVSDEYLMHSLDRLRAFHPDIVAFTGDFITHRVARGDGQFAQLGNVLEHFPLGRLATVAIPGNHDYGPRWRDRAVATRVVTEAERRGIRVLRNDVHTVAGLDIVGIDDLWSGLADTARAFAGRRSAAAIALCHNPDGADALTWSGYRGWILAGHTHGGQCKPPFLPPPLLPVRNRRYVAGEIPIGGDRTLYISRGVGHLIRARFNVRPEITLFTLRSA